MQNGPISGCPLTRQITFTIDSATYFLILDALDTKIEAWEQTAAYHEGEEVDALIEECDDADEAVSIAEDYRAVKIELERQYTAPG